MPRSPSYDFERRERQKAKAAKRAEKTKTKAEKNNSGETNVFGYDTEAGSEPPQSKE